MTIKTIYILSILIMVIFFASCSKPQDVNTWVILNDYDSTMVVVIDNQSSNSIYISEDTWLFCDNDTLYIDAIYKRYNDNMPKYSFNQFNPPSLTVINSYKSVIRKIDFSKLSIDLPKVVKFKVFTSKLPFNKDVNYEEYHSEDAFRNFEKERSFAISCEVTFVKASRNW